MLMEFHKQILYKRKKGFLEIRSARRANKARIASQSSPGGNWKLYNEMRVMESGIRVVK